MRQPSVAGELGDQLVDSQRLGQPGADPGGQGRRGGLAADHDDLDVGGAVLAVEALDDLASVHERHHPVEEDVVRPLAGHPVNGLGPVRSELDLEPALVEPDGVEAPDIGVVLHE